MNNHCRINPLVFFLLVFIFAPCSHTSSLTQHIPLPSYIAMSVLECVWELVGWVSSWEVWWSVSGVDVDGPWSQARAWLLKRSLFCASEPVLPVLFHPCRWGWGGIYPPHAFTRLAWLDAGLNGIVTARLWEVLTGPYANFNECTRNVGFIHLNSAAEPYLHLD